MCQVFRKFGVVKEAFNTRQGFGFVTFSNSDEAQNCMKTFIGSEVLGQEIYIAPAKEKRNVDKVIGDSSKRKDKNGMRQGKDLCGENFEWIHSGSGIGRKLMEKAGWRIGESLGIKGDGLKRALDGRDFGQSSRYGLGFGNYLLVNNNLKKKKMPNQSVLVKKEVKIRKENFKEQKWKIKKEGCKLGQKKNQIRSDLQAGKFNEAYQRALAANNSSLLLFTCEMLDAVQTQLFDHEKCPLTQSV